jgi:hypothetical protein
MVMIKLHYRIFTYGMILLIVVLPFVTCGEVFTLRPTVSGGNNGAGMRLSDLPTGKSIMSEPVEVNGVKLKLEVKMLDISLADLLYQLKKLSAKIKIAVNSTSILATETMKNGMLKRLLFVHSGKGLPILCFSLMLPKKIPKLLVWPQQLPKTADAIIRQYFYFPNRKAYYGVFSTAAYPADALREISGSLRANGWDAVSNEDSLPNGRGEIFFKQRPRSLMLVSIGADGTVIVYTRPVK